MKITKRLFRAFISDEYQYNFQNYLDGDFIYSPGYYQKKVEPKKDKIYMSDSDLLVWEEFDNWPKIRNSYSCKLTLRFKDDTLLSIPSPILFGPRTDDDLILCLATLDNEEPNLKFEFYEKGEKYGKSKSSIVKQDGKLVKTIICINKFKEESVMDFVENNINSRTEEENNVIVKRYLTGVKEMLAKIEEEKFYNEPHNFINESSESYFDNPYYNDGLDLDQQSPEFWDNL